METEVYIQKIADLDMVTIFLERQRVIYMVLRMGGYVVLEDKHVLHWHITY